MINFFKKTKILLIIIFFSFFIFDFSLSVKAWSDDFSGPTVDSVLESTRSQTSYEKDGNIINYPRIVGRFINVFLSLLGIIFVGLTIYAGFLWMTARGDEAGVTKAKDILEHAIIGIVIVVSSYVVTNFIINAFAKNYSTVTGY